MGKSTLLTLLTGTHSEAASYEFTTLTCIPGIIHYNDTKIQLLDLPGIIEGASEGKGRGRQVTYLFSTIILSLYIANTNIASLSYNEWSVFLLTVFQNEMQMDVSVDRVPFVVCYLGWLCETFPSI